MQICPKCKTEYGGSERPFNGETWHISDCCEHPVGEKECKCPCHNLPCPCCGYSVGGSWNEEDEGRAITKRLSPEKMAEERSRLEEELKKVDTKYQVEFPVEPPMGVSQWKTHGILYGYDKYFKIEWPE